MKIVNISKKRAESLKRIELDFPNTEANLYYFNLKNNWETTDKVFKKFFVIEGENFANKLYTITTLNAYQEIMDIKEFVIPDYLISIKSIISGYAMDLVRGVNLSKIIYNPSVDFKIKIDLLKQLSQVLSKMKDIRSYTNLKDFYIGDIHEENIMVDKDMKIKIIDLDSCKIGGNIAIPTRYLQSLKRKGIINDKYVIDENNSDIILPNEQTDYYCLIVLLLNTLYLGNTLNMKNPRLKYKITQLNIDEYYTYLNYLKSIGFSKELIKCFENIYTNKPNINIGEGSDSLLDSIGNEYSRATSIVFEANKRKIK